MPERRHYPRAPIIEAIIDFAVTQREGFSVEDLAAIRDAVADSYPIRENELFYSGEVSVPEPGGDAQYKSAPQHTGFRFTSPDKRQVFYARLGGFAFAVRAPYDRWETFRDEAHRLWDLYRSFTKPTSVTRAGVRYINRIDIPDTSPIDLEDYLRTYPEVSKDLPYEGLMSNFFMQLQMWHEDLRCMLIVNESPTAPPDSDTSSVLLDFDFIREQFEEPWPANDDAAVWEFLEQLHDRKNEVFEASITQRTRTLISRNGQGG
jgi:uncharacterized protein (TIGR04255 family)